MQFLCIRKVFIERFRFFWLWVVPHGINFNNTQIGYIKFMVANIIHMKNNNSKRCLCMCIKYGQFDVDFSVLLFNIIKSCWPWQHNLMIGGVKKRKW